MPRKSYIQVNGILYEKGTEPQQESKKTPMFIPDIKPYRSPITGEPITSRPKERAHMAEHGVTHTRDYTEQYFEKKQKERIQALNCSTPADRAERIEYLKHALERKQS